MSAFVTVIGRSHTLSTQVPRHSSNGERHSSVDVHAYPRHSTLAGRAVEVDA